MFVKLRDVLERLLYYFWFLYGGFLMGVQTFWVIAIEYFIIFVLPIKFKLLDYYHFDFALQVFTESMSETGAFFYSLMKFVLVLLLFFF